MKVKELAKKLANFGTNPKICLEENTKFLAEGSPCEIAESFGSYRVESFVVLDRGQVKIFVSK